MRKQNWKDMLINIILVVLMCYAVVVVSLVAISWNRPYSTGLALPGQVSWLADYFSVAVMKVWNWG